MANFRLNEEKNGVEIIFPAKPADEILAELKAAGFRWGRGYWWAKQTPERLALAARLADGEEIKAEPKKTEPKKEKKNRFGVKVGDLFSASWGYDQTNVDFFQVVALVGETSVRVREVYPPILTRDGVSWASENRTYANTGELLPPADCSVFIKDNEKGDLKRLKSYNKDGSHPQFYLSSFADAYFCEPGKDIKKYVSWYA